MNQLPPSSFYYPPSIKMSLFTKLPQDMLQYEIARFLDHRDILAFNEVVRRGERIYKKLPADFALKHTLNILRQEHNSIVHRYEIYRVAKDFKQRRRAAKAMFRFCLNPRSEIAFMYQTGVKKKLIQFLTPWTSEDMYPDYWYDMSEIRKEKYIEFARAAWHTVAETPFVRHISLIGINDRSSLF